MSNCYIKKEKSNTRRWKYPGNMRWSVPVPVCATEGVCGSLFLLLGIRALHEQKVLFLAEPCLIVQPSIYKYVNMSGTRHNTARLYTPRRSGKEVSMQPPTPPPNPTTLSHPTPSTNQPSKIVFLDGFNEYRMFIVTIPCDLHKRLEKSTSTLPPLLCTLPIHPPSLPPLPPPDPSKHY